MFAVKFFNSGYKSNQHGQLFIDDVKMICIENDITILKTFTIKFMNGVTLDVIDLTSHETFPYLYCNVIRCYILRNLYMGEFTLYDEHSGGIYDEGTLFTDDIFLMLQKDYYQ